jgi:hypothetical protein
MRSFAQRIILVLASLAVMLTLPVVASAGTPEPHLAIEAKAMPTNIPPSGGLLMVLVTNTGGGPTSSEPITIKDTLPPGLIATNAFGFSEPGEHAVECEVTAPSVKPSVVTCSYKEPLVPGDSTEGVEVPIEVAVEEGTSGTLTNTAVVEGGGAPLVVATEPVVVGGSAPFGFDGSFGAHAFDAEGALDVQAGDHPHSLTTEFILNSAPSALNPALVQPVEELKDTSVEIPPGLVGDAQSSPTCPQYLIAPPNIGRQCPSASVVGTVAALKINKIWGFSGGVSGDTNVRPLFNVPPERGHPAQFAFLISGQEATLYVDFVHTAAGYIARVSSPSINRNIELVGIKVTLFGNPSLHDGAATFPTPFLTNPANCAASAASRTTHIHFDSWQNPGKASLDGSPEGSNEVAWRTAESIAPAVSGCDRLRFEPELGLRPDTGQADSPAGYEAVLDVPQNEDPNGLATPPLERAAVTLPAGVSVSPSAANGLVGCQASGGEGIELESSAPGRCPDASTIGHIEVVTPLLSETLKGSIFVAQPTCGGAGEAACTEEAAETGGIFALYVEVGSERSGVHLKLKGTVEVGGNGHHNELAPGQVRTTFADAPQEPFSELRLSFNGGPRAALANPQACGTFTTVSELEPWSHMPAPGEAQGTPNATPRPSFTITGCENRFAPGFTAGTVNFQAGAYSPFTLTFSRNDGEQDLSDVTVTMPPGLLGAIAGIPECGETEANAGSCPPASRIGSAAAAAGAGSDPLWQSGAAYFTGPYKGAPFGLSVVVPANAGPYHLGNVVVRAGIYIDPSTAQITAVSDPLPQSVDGVPLRLKTVNVTVDREGFMFNPTDCEASKVNGTIASTQNDSVAVSSPFEAINCASLPFKPSFTASTQGNGNFNDNGASLDVKIATHQGPSANPAVAAEANIAKVDVQLPLALPSRLTTLQKACTEGQFAANPAGCPAASDVGTAVAHTPVLPVALTGPAYLVSHGGEAFPDLDIVLQGDGVTIDLVGHTQIRKGITYSHFDTVPDAPVSSFELNLPEGRYSALAAITNLCKPTSTKTVKKRVVLTRNGKTVRRDGKVVYITHSVQEHVATALEMPTTITGQNGAVVTQTTKIAVTGCPTAKRAKHTGKTKKSSRKAAKA